MSRAIKAHGARVWDKEMNKRDGPERQIGVGVGGEEEKRRQKRDQKPECGISHSEQLVLI